MLADPAAEILGPHLQGRAGGADRGGAHRRVEGDVLVAGEREPVSRVLAPSAGDERACSAAGAGSLEPVEAPPPGEDLRRVDAQALDPGRALGSGLGFEAYLARPPPTFFGVTSTSSASSSRRRRI